MRSLWKRDRAVDPGETISPESPGSASSAGAVTELAPLPGMDLASLFTPATGLVASPCDWLSSSVVLSASSGFGQELTRLGLFKASGGTELYRMKIPPHLAGKVQLPTGEFYGDIVSVDTGRFVGKATFVSELGKTIGPQVAWAVVTFAVGQQYEREISQSLKTIEVELRGFREHLEDDTRSRLDGAVAGCRRAAWLIMNGADASSVLGGISSQAHEIDSAWEKSLRELKRQQGRLQELRDKPARTSKELVERWPDIYEQAGADFRDFVADFIRALNAKTQLTVL